MPIYELKINKQLAVYGRITSRPLTRLCSWWTPVTVAGSKRANTNWTRCSPTRRCPIVPYWFLATKSTNQARPARTNYEISSAFIKWPPARYTLIFLFILAVPDFHKIYVQSTGKSITQRASWSSIGIVHVLRSEATRLRWRFPLVGTVHRLSGSNITKQNRVQKTTTTTDDH